MSEIAKKKSSKAGRKTRTPTHKRYNLENRRDKHKARRVARFMLKHPNWKVEDQQPGVNPKVANRIRFLFKRFRKEKEGE